MKPKELLSICPDNAQVTMDSMQAAELLRGMIDPNQGKGGVEAVHMYLFGHTRNIVKPIDKKP